MATDPTRRALAEVAAGNAHLRRVNAQMAAEVRDHGSVLRTLRPVARAPFDWENDEFPAVAVHLTLTMPELRLFRADLEQFRPDAPAPVRELATKILRQLEDGGQ